MAVVKELIRPEEDGSISFGDYELSQKTKKSDVEVHGDSYKVKTFSEVTRLECLYMKPSREPRSLISRKMRRA